MDYILCYMGIHTCKFIGNYTCEASWTNRLKFHLSVGFAVTSIRPSPTIIILPFLNTSTVCLPAYRLISKAWKPLETRKICFSLPLVKTISLPRSFKKTAATSVGLNMLACSGQGRGSLGKGVECELRCG